MYSMICFFFLFIFVMFIYLFNFNYKTTLDNKTYFECGFDSIQTYRSLFSLRFFSITIIFLIFDMEIVLILPLVLFYDLFKSIMLIIYLSLLLGMFMEWNQGGLSWK